MKLKIINPAINLGEQYNEEIQDYLKKYLNESTEISFSVVKKGFPSIETEAQGYFNGTELLRTLVELQDTDTDGVFFNCFDDPAITAAKELSKIPVLGPYVPSVLYASLLSEKVAVITTDKYGLLCEERKARVNNFTQLIDEIVNIDLGVLELRDGELESRLKEVIIELRDNNFGAVIFGCTGMHFVAEKLQQEIGNGVQIIEPLRTGMKYLELMVKMGNTNIIDYAPVNMAQLVE